MAATYRTSAAGGSTSGTGDRTCTIVPAVGDLLIVYAFVSTNTNDTPTCSDNNGSGTYTRIDVCNVVISTVNHRLSVFVRNALMVNTTSTVITVATGSNTSGAVHVIAVAGMSRTGADAVRSKGLQNNQSAGTPAPVLNQTSLTTNLTIVACGSADTTTTAPGGWTERQDTNFATPTVALETATRDSGFAGTTITFGAAQSTTFCSHALELNGSALVTRSVALDAVGLIATAATFFSVFTRSVGIDGTGAIATIGEVEPSLTVHERSASLGATGDIQASGFTIRERAASLEATGTIGASGQFFSVFSGAVSLEATGSISSSGVREVSRSAAFDVTGNIEFLATFFSTLTSGASLDAVGNIETVGVVEGPATERSASFNAEGSIQASGHRVLERSVSLNTVGSISASSQRVLLRAASLNTIGSVSVSAPATIQRSASLMVSGQIACSGLVVSPITTPIIKSPTSVILSPRGSRSVRLLVAGSKSVRLYVNGFVRVINRGSNNGN